jgi:uncharacterized protein YndB with AHSA1/START domain
MTDNRRLELEVEVPGTPEQVWEAIATGPGITAWFARAEVEEREGGAVAFDLGGGVESSGVVTAWEPPHRFVYEEPLEDEARLASEWLVEARSGGTCVVRLVSSLFGTDAAWDDELGGMEDGWRSYTHNLRLYLTHFAGRPCAPVTVSGGGDYHRELLVRLSEPAPGTAFVLVYRYQDRTYPAIRAYLFGADAPAVAAREQPRWQAWMDERFASRTPA